MNTLKKMAVYAGLAAAMGDMGNTYFTPFSGGGGYRSGKTQLTNKQKKARAKTRRAQRKARRANR